MSFYYLTNFHKVELENVASIILSFKKENNEILFSYIESNLDFETAIEKDFIIKNTSHISNEWIFPEEPPCYTPDIIWYNVKNKDEIKKAITIENLFRCIIVPSGLNIIEFNYLIYIIEGDNGPVLCIYDKIDDFKQRILPTLKPFIKNCKMTDQI